LWIANVHSCLTDNYLRVQIGSMQHSDFSSFLLVLTLTTQFIP
jgi:hypothetical protein